MADIRVRVGQQNTIRVSSYRVAASKLENVVDNVDTAGRIEQPKTILVYDSEQEKYVHLTAAQLLDGADGSEDGEIDFGSF